MMWVFYESDSDEMGNNSSPECVGCFLAGWRMERRDAAGRETRAKPGRAEQKRMEQITGTTTTIVTGMDNLVGSLKRKSPETEEQPKRQEKKNEQQAEQEHAQPEPSAQQQLSKKLKTAHPTPPSTQSQPKAVVELDKSKALLVIKQKPIELCEVSNQIKKS